MAGYLVLARKYRSATFEEVIGQEPIARTLVNAITSGRVAHAYLFCGTRGVGKTTMARVFAKALNCLRADAPTPTPCNQCDACTAIARGDDVDVVEIDGASNRGIEEIRELRANAIYAPARSRFKVYYIDEVHMLTREAFNALLKTLEEPPGHVKFIFATTEPEKVPATILSRCQRFDFRNIPTARIAEHLETICRAEGAEAEGDALFRVARAATGSMRDALSLLDQLLAGGASEDGGGTIREADVVRVLGAPPDEQMLGIAGAIAAGDAGAALGELSGVLAGGAGLSNVAEHLAGTFRNLMIAATCGADSDLIELPDAARQQVGELAGQFSAPALVQAVAVLQAAERNLRGSSVGRALLEAAVVRLAAAEKFVDPASLLERLEALSAGGASRAGGRVPAGPAGGAAPKKKARPVGAGSTGIRTGGAARAAAHAADSTAGPASGTRTAAAAAEPTVPADDAPADEAQAGPIQWELGWLQANWLEVTDRLMAVREMRVAGALRLATPLAFDDGVLRLGFHPDHERLRQRCEQRLQERADAALSALAGRAIRCTFMEHDNGPDGAAPSQAPAAAAATLNTEEKNAIQKDPAVREVLELFGGEVVDIRKQAPPAAAPDAPDEAEQADAPAEG